MRVLLLGLVLVLAAGCGLVESPEFRGMRGWDDVAFSAAGGAQGTVLLVLYNPNPVALTATEVEVALSVRGKRVGTLSLPEGAILPARREHAVVHHHRQAVRGAVARSEERRVGDVAPARATPHQLVIRRARRR